MEREMALKMMKRESWDLERNKNMPSYMVYLVTMYCLLICKLILGSFWVLFHMLNLRQHYNYLLSYAIFMSIFIPSYTVKLIQILISIFRYMH